MPTLARFNADTYNGIYSLMRKVNRLSRHSRLMDDESLTAHLKELLADLEVYANLFPDLFTAALNTYQSRILPDTFIPNNMLVVPHTFKSISQFTTQAIFIIVHLYTFYNELYRSDIGFLRYAISKLYKTNKAAVLDGVRQFWNNLDDEDISEDYRRTLQQQATIHLCNRFSVN